MTEDQTESYIADVTEVRNWNREDLTENKILVQNKNEDVSTGVTANTYIGSYCT